MENRLEQLTDFELMQRLDLPDCMLSESREWLEETVTEIKRRAEKLAA